MTTYNTLKKIIPPDQALANEALSRSLRQIKDVFDTDLPSFAAAVTNLESNRDLDLINDLSTPIPSAVANIWSSTLATGTGPGNTITTDDVIGIAGGATVTTVMPDLVVIIDELANIGALDPLVSNGGTSGSVDNGVYTLMNYALTGVYSNAANVLDTTTIPTTNYYTGAVFGNVSDAFGSTGNGLIAAASNHIANITITYANLAAPANDISNSMANQLNINVVNCTAAGIDIGNVVNDIANANLNSNDLGAVMSLTSQLHDIGLAVETGGPAQFFEQVANTSTTSGQAVISAMREGRNIALLNAAGLTLDTQLSPVNPDQTVANNISDGQYTVAEARANIVL